MIPDELQRKPGYLIRRAQQAAVAIFLQECRPYDVTPVQYGVLRLLRQRPGVDQATLAGLVAVDRSTMADVAARLEERGLLFRAPGADRRVKLLSLTVDGERLLDDIEDAVDRAQQRMLAPLSPDERGQFLALLEKLVASADEGG